MDTIMSGLQCLLHVQLDLIYTCSLLLFCEVDNLWFSMEDSQWKQMDRAR